MYIADLWMAWHLTYRFFFACMILAVFLSFSLSSLRGLQCDPLTLLFYHFWMVSNDLAKSVKSVNLTGIGHMPSSRVLHEWPFPCDFMVCGHLRWKMACRACFKSGHCPGKGNGQHFYLRSQGWYLWNFAQQVFFQCRWPQTIESQGNGHSCKTLVLGIWPIPVKTSDDFIFIDFWLGFTDFATW